MSTQISKSLIALFFLGMFVTGCNTNTKQTADNDIKFDSIRVDRTYHLLNNPDNPNCNLQLNFTYPAKFSDKEILKKIQNDFVLSYFGENYENLSPEEAVAKYTEDYLNNYKELEARQSWKRRTICRSEPGSLISKCHRMKSSTTRMTF